MERFYYNRDEWQRPIETVCLITDGKDFARGIARCNLELDCISKKLGREIAKGRAVKTMILKKNLGFLDGTLRGQFNPELTDFEKRLFSPPEKPQAERSQQKG